MPLVNSRAETRIGYPIALEPLSLRAVTQAKAIVAATLAANLVRENRSRLARRLAHRGNSVGSPLGSRVPISHDRLPALHQAVPTMGPFDAVSNDVLALQALLQGSGYRSEVFAEHVHASLRGRVHSLDSLSDPDVDADPLLYHVSTQAPRVVGVLLERSGPVYLRHHNITPAEWFTGISAGHEAACREARSELAQLGAIAQAGTADSAYNADELLGIGMRNVDVVPILLAPAEDPPVWTGGGGYAITVGRIAPNKRIDFALRSIAAYQQLHDPGFGLVIVGSDRGMERYADACRSLEAELGVRNVRWVGSVEEGEKLRLMAEADAYLCASDHEGFCVPIVESFRLGLPVVARATSAVTDTCGEALAVDTADPAFLANVLRVVVDDAELRTRLLATQREEAKRFEPALVGEQVLAWARSHVAR
jgi:glycosyltransferase involved in cell wall biosynthesis